jgi:hypothetical protein
MATHAIAGLSSYSLKTHKYFKHLYHGQNVQFRQMCKRKLKMLDIHMYMYIECRTEI